MFACVIYVCVHVAFVCTYMYVCMCVRLYVCMCVIVYVHACIHVVYVYAVCMYMHARFSDGK